MLQIAKNAVGHEAESVTLWASLALANLLPHRIATYPKVFDRVPVRAPNASSAMYCYTNDGRQWVRKVEPASTSTFAECICWLLAKELGVPVPAGAVYHPANGDRLWMSEWVGESTHWVGGTRIANREDIARVLLLDVLVDNGDRHRRNILLVPEADGTRRFIAIDYDGAGVGLYMSQRAHEPGIPKVPSPPFWLSEIEEQLLAEHMDDAVRSLDALLKTPRRLDAVAEHALVFGTGTARDSDVSDLVEYLRWRAEAAQTMAWAYWKEARSVCL